MKYTICGLFAGIGGIERGFESAGFEGQLLCEIDPGAQAVLAERFPGLPLVSDIRNLRSVPKCDVLAAGFPCQDLSQAGKTAGISGAKSSLVGEVFRLLDGSRTARGVARWVVLENVPFMLQLDRGNAMKFLTEELSARGYLWGYRVVDTRAFGIPQRRRRVILLASKSEDPRPILFSGDSQPSKPIDEPAAFGFYWTEGLRGLGWAEDSVPTLKGGSTIGIPSPPAIWIPATNEIVTPDLRDAERLQGFEAEWTKPSETAERRSRRWNLVGNAVSVPVSRWLARRLTSQDTDRPSWSQAILKESNPWPTAAWGFGQQAFSVNVGPWPVAHRMIPILDFLKFPAKPLSLKAATGFLNRAEQSSLRFRRGFLDAVRTHIGRMNRDLPLTA
jgi:DNA (cytosine-5)-methyltransferase 1